MAPIWRIYGPNMATIWPKYGEYMAHIWPKYGILNMLKVDMLSRPSVQSRCMMLRNGFKAAA
jgi:hypothetical protein